MLPALVMFRPQGRDLQGRGAFFRYGIPMPSGRNVIASLAFFMPLPGDAISLTPAICHAYAVMRNLLCPGDPHRRACVCRLPGFFITYTRVVCPLKVLLFFHRSGRLLQGKPRPLHPSRNWTVLRPIHCALLVSSIPYHR